jgi:hypothetical protein
MSAAVATFCSARTRRDLTCNRRAKWRCTAGHELCGTHAVTGLCAACGAALTTPLAGVNTTAITAVLADGPEPLTT